jgi:predicted RecB family nuclease
MTLTASDFYRAYRPSECDLRLYLHHRGVKAAEPGPFEEVIRRLGERHERARLGELAGVLNLGDGTLEDRQRRTLEAIRTGVAVIYQAVLMAVIRLGGRECTVVGIPDFLIREGDGYVIHDVKISRRITESAHPEILWQLRLYGRLFQLVTDCAPVRLEVYNGQGAIVPVEPASVDAVEQRLTHLLDVVEATEAPFEPVGWTRCGGCGYHDRCWTEAEARNDVALVIGVDKSIARALRGIKIVSYDDLLNEFEEARLSEFQRPRGQKMQRIGKAAASIMLSARALQSQQPIALAPPAIPDHANFVMFDLEGLPPHLDELEKIYLWGLQVYGKSPSAFTAATADFGAGGDCEGWEQFLRNAAQTMKDYGNIPFVHWSPYEKTKLKLYIERYGDRDGVAAAVLANLFNLLPVVENAVMLPLQSYSLKVVEEYVGFKRTQQEYGGQWSMAQYIEATETEDEAARQRVMEAILKYNEEDLAATWAVLCWIRDFGRGAGNATDIQLNTST